MAAERKRDPEIAALLETTRDIVGEMFRLSRDLGSTVDELTHYSESYDAARNDRRTRQTSFMGEDRRRD